MTKSSFASKFHCFARVPSSDNETNLCTFSRTASALRLSTVIFYLQSRVICICISCHHKHVYREGLASKILSYSSTNSANAKLLMSLRSSVVRRPVVLGLSSRHASLGKRKESVLASDTNSSSPIHSLTSILIANRGEIALLVLTRSPTWIY